MRRGERGRGKPAEKPPAATGGIANPTAFRPVDLYTLAYLAFGLALLLLFPGRVPHPYRLAAYHAAGMAALIAARRLGLGRARLGTILLDFYPLPLFAALYTEVAVLNRLLHRGVFLDAGIQRVEAFLFRSQPARDLHLMVPWRPLGEYLHLGYFSYYFLLPGLAFTLWFRRSREAYHTAVACVGLAFYVCFGFFIAMPVAGPYYAFLHSDPDKVGYLLPHLVRWLLSRGSSIGAAFPSSHVAVSVTIWIMAMRYHRRLATVYAFLVPALALGAIYGGYHYATDVTAGAILAVLVGTLGHRATLALYRRAATGSGLSAARRGS